MVECGPVAGGRRRKRNSRSSSGRAAGNLGVAAGVARLPNAFRADFVDESGVTTDLPGNTRIQFTTVDMGAYEWAFSVVGPSPTATPSTFSEIMPSALLRRASGVTSSMVPESAPATGRPSKPARIGV